MNFDFKKFLLILIVFWFLATFPITYRINNISERRTPYSYDEDSTQSQHKPIGFDIGIRWRYEDDYCLAIPNEQVSKGWPLTVYKAAESCGGRSYNDVAQIINSAILFFVPLIILSVIRRMHNKRDQLCESYTYSKDGL